MPASFSPAPNSMASLSIEEGAASRQSPSHLGHSHHHCPCRHPRGEGEGG